jgi:membrane protein DedA with SNARE-associated domain
MHTLIDQIDNFIPRLADLVRTIPWPLMLPMVAIAVSLRDRIVAVLVILMVAAGTIDIRAGLIGILLGQAIGAGSCYFRGRDLRRRSIRPRIIGEASSARTPRGWLHLMRRRALTTALFTRFMPGEHGLAFTASGFSGRLPPRFAAAAILSWVLWTAFYAGVTFAIGAPIEQFLSFHAEFPGLLLGSAIAVVIPNTIALGLTYHGRRRVRTIVSRWTHREFWPTSIIYFPLLPLLAYLTLRRRGFTVFTCCNPGIAFGGGIVGESKKAILDALGSGPAEGYVLASHLISADLPPEQRAVAALHAIRTRPELGGFPIILKPDTGERGYALKLARTPDDLRRYFTGVHALHAPVLLQAYHSGPFECGILWARYPDGPRHDGRGGREGFIFSITRKDFPVLIGDGIHTLEELILDHPRFHAQADVFLERFAGQRQRILRAGQALRLAEAGNHCQGTLFRDGIDLWSQELEDRIDSIARNFAPPPSHSRVACLTPPDASDGASAPPQAPGSASPLLDIGRFDIRYESDDALRRGQGFAIVEFNGTFGESTNIYDPNRSLFWMYRTLARQIRLIYELGASRRDAGIRPIPLLEVLLTIFRHQRSRGGRSSPALAD